MKRRRHHNNTGYRRIKRDRLFAEVKRMAARAGIPYRFRSSKDEHPAPNREAESSILSGTTISAGDHA